jgi:hypothetical protein
MPPITRYTVTGPGRSIRTSVIRTRIESQTSLRAVSNSMKLRGETNSAHRSTTNVVIVRAATSQMRTR